MASKKRKLNLVDDLSEESKIILNLCYQTAIKRFTEKGEILNKYVVNINKHEHLKEFTQETIEFILYDLATTFHKVLYEDKPTFSHIINSSGKNYCGFCNNNLTITFSNSYHKVMINNLISNYHK